jgi:hypothetical protein
MSLALQFRQHGWRKVKDGEDMMVLGKSVVILFCIGFVLMAMGGCSSPGPTTGLSATTSSSILTTSTSTTKLATGAKDIDGIWVGLGADRLYQRFNLDGTNQTARTLENLTAKPDAESTFKFEGNRFIVTEVAATGLPSAGPDPGVYEVQLLQNGDIKFTKIQDASSGRARSTAQEYKPVY